MIWATLNEMDEEVRVKPKPQPVASHGAKSDWILAADVYQNGKNVVVKMNLPGVDPEAVDISVSADSIKVSGTSEDEEVVDNKDYYLREIRRGSFERVIKLPVRVEMDKAEADYKKGILKITVPRREDSFVNKIKVKSGSY